MIRDTVAQVAGITGRSSPAPNGGVVDPEGRFGQGEEQPSFPATTEGESHIKAPPSTSEVLRPSEGGRGRLRDVAQKGDGTRSRDESSDADVVVGHSPPSIESRRYENVYISVRPGSSMVNRYVAVVRL